VIEVQLDPNALKLYRWPIILAGAFARFRCPIDLIVLTLDRSVAEWARRPLVVGRLRGAMNVTPTVIGPDQIPKINDVEQARRSPGLAVLSALAHADDPEAVDIAAAALTAAHDHLWLLDRLELRWLVPGGVTPRRRRRAAVFSRSRRPVRHAVEYPLVPGDAPFTRRAASIVQRPAPRTRRVVHHLVRVQDRRCQHDEEEISLSQMCAYAGFADPKGRFSTTYCRPAEIPD
jgi:hypothetical protein